MPSPATTARTRIGPWPLTDHTPAAAAARTRLTRAPDADRFRIDHARQVWQNSVRNTGLGAYSIAAVAGQSNVAGISDLAFVGELSEHLAACASCWAGRVGYRPVDWLTWGCSQRAGLVEVLAPVLVEAAGRARQHRPGRPVVG